MLKINKIICFLFAILPILLMYGWGSVTFADIAMLILLLYTLVTYKLFIKKEFLILGIFFIIHPIILYIFIDNDNYLIDMFGTSYRLAFYIISTGFLLSELSNKTYLMKIIRCISVLCSIYAIFQFLFANFFDVLLSAYLPYLPHIGNSDAETQLWINYGMIVRPRSFFSEPSTFSLYLLWSLCLELYVFRVKRLSNIVILIIGILISLSSLGFIGLIYLLITFTFKYIIKRESKISPKYILYFLLALLVGIVCSLELGLFDFILNHITAGGKGILFTTRFVDIKTVFLSNDFLRTFLIGNGLQDIKAYLPGWTRVYYCTGIVGFLLYLYLFYRTYKMTGRGNKILVVLFALVNIGSETMMGIFFVLFFTMCYYDCSENYSIKKNISG